MNILTIALKDLKQIARDRMSALFLLIMPLAFTFMMGAMFGGNKQADYRLPVGILNNDPQGELSSMLIELLGNSTAIKLVDLAPADESKISDQINSGKLAAALILPANYSSDLLSGKDIKVSIIANTLNTGGQTALAALQTSISQLMGALQTARLSLQAVDSQKPVADRNTFMLAAVQLVLQKWQSPSMSIITEPVSKASNAGGFSGYVQTSPGMLVQFTIAGLIGAAAVLVLERKNRTITRLLTAPVTRAEIILGHLLGITVTVLLQELILVLAGQFFFKVDYLRQPLATFVMMLAVALFCGSLGLFFGAISKREEQAIMYPLIAMFVLTALGGAWFPLEGTSPAFYTIGHALPTAWAMDGFQNIILRGLGFSSILLPALILLGYAALFFVLAVWRMRWE
jgi:ABC-2 type transport system permease protein